jgi:hypothetical protein
MPLARFLLMDWYSSCPSFWTRSHPVHRALSGCPAVLWRATVAPAAHSQDLRLALPSWPAASRSLARHRSGHPLSAPVIIEHMVYLGASYQLTSNFSLSAAYFHAFKNTVEGPLVTPAGAVPGTSVRNGTSGDSLIIGATLKFGGSGHTSQD